MCYPSLKEFLKLSRQGNLIPVYKEINADLDTPVSAYLKIKKDEYAFLLESVEGQEKVARYSFLGSNPSLVFKSKGKNIEIVYPHKKEHIRYVASGDPLKEIEKLMRPFRVVPIKGLPRFHGGLVGYIGYDMVRFFEKLPDKNPDELKFPDAVLLLTDTILVFDHVNHVIKIVSNVFLPDKSLSASGKTKIYQAAVKKIENICREFGEPPAFKEKKYPKNKKVRISSNFTKEEFKELVIRAKKYIKKGDIIQVVPSQRFQVETHRDSFDIYRRLRSINPSPYMFFLELGSLRFMGASPEMLVRCEEGTVETHPIAGTRPRGNSEEKDRLLETELLRDTKEKAEHLMLVDLGRNDLGRVCKSGSVKVTRFMGVERYSHVMHLVSEVKGELKKGYSSFDALRACFPAGTVSGSPKIRAMEIIDELENTRRGPYAGSVGYFSFSGNMDTCITLRTIFANNSFTYVQAGGGIVADSIPEKEYYETVNKAKALIEAATS